MNRFAILAEYDDLSDTENPPVDTVDSVSDPDTDLNSNESRVPDLRATFTPGYIREHFVELQGRYPSQFTEDMYESLWESWRRDNELTVVDKDIAVKLDEIQEFLFAHLIKGPVNSRPVHVVTDQDPKQRFCYHQICTNLGLEHQSMNALKGHRDSKGKDKGKGSVDHYDSKFKTLEITRPKAWCWEFTKVSESQQKLDESSNEKRKEKEDDWRERMSRKRCRICRRNALQRELVRNDELGLYCKECVATKATREDISLTEYKFTHAYGRKDSDEQYHAKQTPIKRRSRKRSENRDRESEGSWKIA